MFNETRILGTIRSRLLPKLLSHAPTYTRCRTLYTGAVTL